MKKQKFDDIEYSFQVVSEDFKNMVERKFKLSMVELNGTIQFETTIPDYIYDEAKKLWPEDYDFKFIKTKRNEFNKSGFGGLEWDLRHVKSKILRSPTLDVIKSDLWELSKKIETYYTFEETIGDKVLFISFKGNTGIKRYYSNGADMGLVNSINFQYFVAYHHLAEEKKWLSDEIMTVERYTSHYKCGMMEGDQNKYREDGMFPLHTTQNELNSLKSNYLIVPWSEEREIFLKEIQNTFTKLTERLNEFLKDLTEDKLDKLIENSSVMKFLNP